MKNIEDIKEIYKLNCCNPEIMPREIRSEFEALNIPQIILEEWEEEWYYTIVQKIKDYYSSTKEKNLSESDKLLNRMNIILYHHRIQPDHFSTIVDLFELSNKKNDFHHFIGDTRYRYISFGVEILSSRDHFTRIFQDQEIIYETHQDFVGFVPYLYFNRYIELYNRMIIVLLDYVSKKKNTKSQFIEDFICFAKFIHDDKLIRNIEFLKNIE